MGGALRDCGSKGKKEGMAETWMAMTLFMNPFSVCSGVLRGQGRDGLLIFLSSLSSLGPRGHQLTGVRIGRVRTAAAPHVTDDSHSVVGAVSGGFVLWC